MAINNIKKIINLQILIIKTKLQNQSLIIFTQNSITYLNQSKLKKLLKKWIWPLLIWKILFEIYILVSPLIIILLFFAKKTYINYSHFDLNIMFPTSSNIIVLSSNSLSLNPDEPPSSFPPSITFIILLINFFNLYYLF